MFGEVIKQPDGGVRNEKPLHRRGEVAGIGITESIPGTVPHEEIVS
jgi:hypothetical protein